MPAKITNAWIVEGCNTYFQNEEDAQAWARENDRRLKLEQLFDDMETSLTPEEVCTFILDYSETIAMILTPKNNSETRM